MTKANLTNDEIEFLDHSNRIEDVRSEEALEDAIEAWEYAKSLSEITLKDLFEIHRLLLKRIDPDIAGRFRTYDIQIGGKIKKFRGLEVLESQTQEALDLLKEGEALPLAAQRNGLARRAHVQYEDVHPFPDGNGRSGRILYNWHRAKLGLPLHIIHEGDEQMEYYTWFTQPKKK